MKKIAGYTIVFLLLFGSVFVSNARQSDCFGDAINAFNSAGSSYRGCVGDCGSNVYCSGFCYVYYQMELESIEEGFMSCGSGSNV
ncbi:MAG: hypothetical protein WBA74_09335 [Cyclobacteriaceae bacterium]